MTNFVKFRYAKNSNNLKMCQKVGLHKHWNFIKNDRADSKMNDKSPKNKQNSFS